MTEPTDWSLLTDSQLLGALKWGPTAPPELVTAARAGRIPEFLQAWLQHQPQRPVPDGWTTLWSLDCRTQASWPLRLQSLVEALTGATARKGSAAGRQTRTVAALKLWWTEFASSAVTPWETLLLLEAWPLVARSRETQLAWQLWRHLWEQATNLATTTAPTRHLLDGPVEFTLAQYGELPWQAGVFFAPLKLARTLRKHGSNTLEAVLADGTDTEGIPLAQLLPRLPLVLACWTRAVGSSLQSGLPLWDQAATELWRDVVEHCAPLILPDGHFALSDVQLAESREMIATMFRSTGWADAEAALIALLPTKSRRAARGGGHKMGALPGGKAAADRPTQQLCLAPVSQSDQAGWSLMRSQWSPHADVVVITHDETTPRLFIQAAGQLLIDAAWTSRLVRNGQTIPITGDWSCVCWQTDPDGDYIELQCRVPGVGRVERQVLVSRTQHFCILTEALSEMKSQRFDHVLEVPLVSGWQPSPERTTRDIRLQREGQTVRVFPLALRDQRIHSTPGECQVMDDRIQYQRTVEGTACYTPLILDWSPTRTSASPAWRTLTVTEDHKVLASDVASAYRLQLGNYQWLLYRALQRSEEARNFLGHQTRYETVIGSVSNTGEVSPLMMVE